MTAKAIKNIRQTHEKHTPLPVDFVRVDGRYRVGKLLGFGNSGSVYLGRDIIRGGDVALKIAHEDHSRLHYENQVYKAIAGSKGISPRRWYGHEGNHDVIVLEHLGTSLGDLINTQQFDHAKTFSFASQMLSAVESLHTRNHIHRDIKPDNFMIRADNAIFLIDFDLAQLFRDPRTHLHIPYSTNLSVVGTRTFTSINGQQGHAQSRRDDLESLAYTIIFSACGDLPWASLSDWEAVLQEKLSTTVEELCAGLPAPFCKFISHVRDLGFEKKPDYPYLHSILLQCSQWETDVPDKALAPSTSGASPTVISDQIITQSSRYSFRATPARLKARKLRE